MRVPVKKSAIALRIPESIMVAAALRVDQEVEVREEEGWVIIEPVCAPSYDLDALLARMHPATFPEEVDFGPSAGKEVW